MSLSSFCAHLDKTWYKNSQKLRSASTNWASIDFHDRIAPHYVGRVAFDERVWSIPTQIADHLIVAGCWDNAIHCIDLNSLERVWRLETRGPVYSTAAVVPDGRFVIGCEDGILRQVSPAGDCIWAFHAGGPFHGTPTIDVRRGVVYSGCFDNTIYAIDLRTGTERWSVQYDPRVEECIYCSPALTPDGNIIFGVDNVLRCLSPEGAEIWQFEGFGRFDGTAALDYHSAVGVIGNEDGKDIYLFNFNTGEILNTFVTGGQVVSCPCVSTDSIFCVGSNDGYVYGIDIENLNLRWKLNIGFEFRFTAFTTLPSGNALFVSVDEKLHCVEPSQGDQLWELEMDGGAHSAPLFTSRGDLVVGSHRNLVHFFRW